MHMHIYYDIWNIHTVHKLASFPEFSIYLLRLHLNMPCVADIINLGC